MHGLCVPCNGVDKFQIDMAAAAKALGATHPTREFMLAQMCQKCGHKLSLYDWSPEELQDHARHWWRNARCDTTPYRPRGFDGSRADGGPLCAFLALERSCAHVLTAPILADVFTCAGCLWWTTRAESRIIVFISLVRSSRG